MSQGVLVTHQYLAIEQHFQTIYFTFTLISIRRFVKPGPKQKMPTNTQNIGLEE